MDTLQNNSKYLSLCGLKNISQGFVLAKVSWGSQKSIKWNLCFQASEDFQS